MGGQAAHKRHDAPNVNGPHIHMKARAKWLGPLHDQLALVRRPVQACRREGENLHPRLRHTDHVLEL